MFWVVKKSLCFDLRG
jgi:SAM-dependent methyltransferase